MLALEFDRSESKDLRLDIDDAEESRLWLCERDVDSDGRAEELLESLSAVEDVFTLKDDVPRDVVDDVNPWLGGPPWKVPVL